jgi:hypothetical protein
MPWTACRGQCSYWRWTQKQHTYLKAPGRGTGSRVTTTDAAANTQKAISKGGMDRSSIATDPASSIPSSLSISTVAVGVTNQQGEVQLRLLQGLQYKQLVWTLLSGFVGYSCLPAGLRI